MQANSKKDWAFQYIWGFCRTPYLWGGNSPSGIDCSGLVIEYLRAMGQVSESWDRTAQQLHDIGVVLTNIVPKFGDIVFMGAGPKGITHCGIVLAPGQYLSAEGRGWVRVRGIRKMPYMNYCDPLAIKE